MFRRGVWTLVFTLIWSWFAPFAAPSGAAANGAREQIRYDRGDFVYLTRAAEPTPTYVAPPAQLGYLRAQSATITVQYVNFPPNAQAAFQQAVAIWQGVLTTPVPISVVAYWEALDETQLGGAAPVNGFSNFDRAPQRDVFYPSALANALAGTDLAPNQPDIEAVFNSTLDDWYFGNGQTPADQLNFISTVVHEIGHGLGFSGTARVENGTGRWGTSGRPRAYDLFAVNGNGVGIINTAQFPNPSVALAEQLQGNNLFWSGMLGGAANGGVRPKLYAPSSWQQGSSYSHLDERTYPAGTENSLMTPALAAGETVYNPGPVALGMLADMGWTIAGGATQGQVCFPETGKCAKGRFLQYWQQNGGLAQQGFPITDEFDEVNPTDGKTYKTQYFERARFEYHPENAAPYDVLLGLLGREQLGAKYGTAIPAAMTTSPLGTDCATFAQTGKQVCGLFLQYWQANGGLAQQGLPLTDLFLETNPTDGKQYPTQYFERARFEYHVENLNSPYVVLLGLLGREQYQARYGGGTPSPSPSASPTPSPSPSPTPQPSASPSPPTSPVPSASPAPSASPGAWGPNLPPLAGGQVYADPGGLFTISIPGSWQIEDAEAGSVVFTNANPPAICYVQNEPVPVDVTLSVLDQELDVENAKYPNYQQVSKDKVQVRNVPAYRRIIDYTLNNGTAVRETQIYFIHTGTLALVRCTATTAQFAAYAPTFDGIGGSLKLKTMAIAAAPSDRHTLPAATPLAHLRLVLATRPAVKAQP